MPGVKVQVDIPTDGNSVRAPMVDGEPGQVNFSNIKYRFLFTFIFNTIFFIYIGLDMFIIFLDIGMGT